MICKKCGAEVAEELTFCTVCGEEMEHESKEKGGMDAEKKKKLMLIGGIGIGAIILLLLALLIFGGNGAESRVEDLYESALEYDLNGLLEALPPEVLTYFKNKIDLENSELEIVNSRELKESRITALDKRYHEVFGTDYGYIEDACVVEVELTYHNKDVSKDPIDLYMIKVDGSWYLDILNTVQELEEAEIRDNVFPTPQSLIPAADAP